MEFFPTISTPVSRYHVALLVVTFLLHVCFSVALLSQSSIDSDNKMNLKLSDDSESDTVGNENDEMAYIRANNADLDSNTQRGRILFHSGYPAYRSSFGSIRFITPYALQHLLASRFQNPEYPGKRMGSEFLGKKRSSLPITYQTLDHQYSLQKKMGSEFLGRRRR